MCEQVEFTETASLFDLPSALFLETYANLTDIASSATEKVKNMSLKGAGDDEREKPRFRWTDCLSWRKKGFSSFHGVVSLINDLLMSIYRDGALLHLLYFLICREWICYTYHRRGIGFQRRFQTHRFTLKKRDVNEHKALFIFFAIWTFMHMVYLVFTPPRNMGHPYLVVLFTLNFR